jgi:tRNA pseudouridine32 synthase/23S rRNA pseudouridine746 synthase
MFTIVDQTAEFLLINKHAGVPFHKGNQDTGLTAQIRSLTGLTVLYPVHRLDNMTSGLLLFAKNRDSAREITRQFREKEIEKYYIALAPGQPQKKQGTVIGDIVKGRNCSWILSRTFQNPSITQFFSAGLGNGLRLYLIKPHTGKTHQIRVIMKSQSVPILGDSLYFKDKDYGIIAERGYLHAFCLRFTLYNQFYSYVCRPDEGVHFLSDSFNSALLKFAEPWNKTWPALKKTSKITDRSI